jgi:hypothetical protein
MIVTNFLGRLNDLHMSGTFSFNINCYHTSQKNENKRWSLFPSTAAAVAVKSCEYIEQKEKKMKENNVQRACNGCPIPFYPLF